jgi:hypothetical protein
MNRLKSEEGGLQTVLDREFRQFNCDKGNNSTNLAERLAFAKSEGSTRREPRAGFRLTICIAEMFFMDMRFGAGAGELQEEHGNDKQEQIRPPRNGPRSVAWKKSAENNKISKVKPAFQQGPQG